MSFRKSCSESVVISPRARFPTRLDLVVRVDDRDLRLVEGGVNSSSWTGLELELVERERDLVRVEAAGLETALQQPLRFVGREHVLDRDSSGRALRFPCGQTAPSSWPSHGSRRSGGRQRREPASGSRLADRLQVARGLVRRSRRARASRDARRSWRSASSMRPVQSRAHRGGSAPRACPGTVARAGRGGRTSAAVLVELPDRGRDLGLRVAGGTAGRLLEDAGGRHGPAHAPQPHPVERSSRTPPTRARLSSADSYSAGAAG